MKKKIEYKPVLKKFLMTLAATTISIILTFGTSSFRENRKQKAAVCTVKQQVLQTSARYVFPIA